MFDLKPWDIYRESNRLEVKRGKGGLPADMWESYSAFANTDGGVIIIGVDEREDGSWSTVGLTEVDVRKLQKSFWDCINNSRKVSEKIVSDKDVEIAEHNGGYIFIINIPRASRSSRPIYIGSDIFKGTYRRNDSGDYRCKKSEVLAMLRDQGEETCDMTVIERFDLSVFNKESLNAYRINYKNSHAAHPWDDVPDELFLKNIGAAAVGEKDGKLHPTGAGLLMFGNEYDIVREFPNYFLDYREMVNDITDWSDRIHSQSGDWSGNVFDFYRRIITRLVSDLKTPLKFDGIHRVDDTPAHKAVREALANCLSNADYYGSCGIVVKKHLDKLVFENPGTIRVGKDQMIAGGKSDPRNKVILKMFNMLNIGERAGSGYNRIVSGWESTGFEAPYVKEETGDTERTYMVLPTIYKSTQKTDENGAQKTVKVKLYKTAQSVLNAIVINPSITREMLATDLHISESTVKKHIKRLKDLELIERVGGDKNGYWRTR